jgi:glycosyltransferase involved in cell wall biosynthesis
MAGIKLKYDLMTKATFLMTAYNSRKTIAEAVNSVLNQSYKEFQLIIVDDASTDDTQDIVASIKDSRIQLIRNETNLYIPDAANVGLAKIETPYMLRIDSDDICLPNRLEMQLDYMEKHPLTGVCGSYVHFFGYKNVNWIMPCENNEIKAYMLFNNCFANSSVIVRMDVLKLHNLSYRNTYLYPPMEDYDLWFRMMPVTQFANLPEVLVKKRWHKDSMSVVYSSQAWHKLDDFFNEHLPTLGFKLNSRETDIHTLFSSNLKGEYFSVKPEEYAAYFKNFMAQAALIPILDIEAVKQMCIKKWMLLSENINPGQIDKIREHLRLTKELFGENMWGYFVKKKLRQLISKN